jgi:hypothetical protein
MGEWGGKSHKKSKENARENYIKIKYRKYKVM